MNKKIGRNDPCPCGSGKKYKKCCESHSGSKRKFQASVISTQEASKGKGMQGKTKTISTNFFSDAQTKKEEPPPKMPDVKKPEKPPETEKPM